MNSISTFQIDSLSYSADKYTVYSISNLDGMYPTVGEAIRHIVTGFGKYDAVTVLHCTEDVQTRVRLRAPLDPNGTYRVFALPFQPLFDMILEEYRQDPDTWFDCVGEKYRLMYWIPRGAEAREQDRTEWRERLVYHIQKHLAGEEMHQPAIVEFFMVLKGEPESL